MDMLCHWLWFLLISFMDVGTVALFWFGYLLDKERFRQVYWAPNGTIPPKPLNNPCFLLYPTCSQGIRFGYISVDTAGTADAISGRNYSGDRYAQRIKCMLMIIWDMFWALIPGSSVKLKKVFNYFTNMENIVGGTLIGALAMSLYF